MREQYWQISGGATNTVSQYQYGYDDGGNRIWVKRGNNKGDVFKYDATDQLTNVVYEATNVDTTPISFTNKVTYYFDAAGNRTGVVTTNSGGQTSNSYVANVLNQYTSVAGVAYGYDPNGNLTNDVARSYYYDRENRLIRATNSTVSVTNIYDSFNRLVERQAGTNKTRFIYDNRWRVIAEYNQQDVLIAKYVYGPRIDEVARMFRNSAYYYYEADALGSVVAIRDGTASAGLVESYSYDVYGTPTIYNSGGSVIASSTVSNRFMFQGRDRDPDTGLYNFRTRYYSPSLGRFLQVDRIRQRGGLNLYRFVGNNPINAVDPDGRYLWLIGITLGVATLALLGYAVYHAEGVADIGNHNREVENDKASSPTETPTQNSKAIGDALADSAEDYYVMATTGGTLAGGPVGIPENAGDAAITLGSEAVKPDASGDSDLLPWESLFPPDSTSPTEPCP